MVYVVLNGLIGVFLIWYSFHVEQKMDEQRDNPLVTLNGVLAVLAFTMAVAVFCCKYAPPRVAEFCGRIALIAVAWYALEFCAYCIFFPSFRRPLAAKIGKYVLLALCAGCIFHYVTAVDITEYLGIHVSALPLFGPELSQYLTVSWYDFYRFMLMDVLPVISVLIMLLRSEAREARLDHQKAVLNASALVVFWLAMFVLGKATERVPLFETLFPAAFLLVNAILVHAATQNVLYDGMAVLGSLLRFLLCYLIPAAVIGLLFPLLHRTRAVSPLEFAALVLCVVAIALMLSYQITKFFNRLSVFRTVQYVEQLEQDLAGLDYDETPEQIVRNMREMLTRNIGISRVQVLVNNNTDTMDSAYDEEGWRAVRIPMNEKVLDSLLNQNRTILLRSATTNGYSYGVNRADLQALFDRADCDAIILLTEGRHLLGALLLGKKSAGNVYNDYDEDVFTRLYSYFFVFGYYMKNIANQSVVGTVNREIRMSAQIITSIQENMDPIRSPKVNAGYLMRHAHNIGGEFVDLIRLSDTRHIFVMGDLSGKGISASMSMVIVKSIIRTFLAETRDFKLLVEKVNQFIRFNLPKGTFFEGVFGLIDFSDNMMYYVNCGVPALFVYTRAFNNVIEVQGEGRVLGFVKDIGPLIKVKKLKLNPGDIVVACTDGLIDCRSLRGERFGRDRVQKAITENAMYDGMRMAQFIFDSLTAFLSKELDDDVSILVLKCLSN